MYCRASATLAIRSSWRMTVMDESGAARRTAYALMRILHYRQRLPAAPMRSVRGAELVARSSGYNPLQSRLSVIYDGEDAMSTIESVLQEHRVFPPPADFVKQANVSGM